MPSGGGFIEGEEEDGEGDEAMECSSVPGGGGGGGPEQLLPAFGPGVKGTVGGSEEVGRSDVGVASRHDGTDSPSNHRSQSTTGLDKRSELHADPASNQTESSGSEHPEQERAQSHSEIMRAMREMKRRLPSERKGHRKARTVEALRYALRCVKQVQASSEYHKVLLGSWKEEQGEVSPTVCTLEELESVTSEQTLKNTGMFAVVFSLASGRVLYVSEQAPSILGLRGSFLRQARFVELLYPQDVNVFYARTAQPHLPPWTLGPDRKADLYDCTWVKSFFCRLRGGKDGEGEVRYSPFRLTPYLLKVRGGEGEEDQPCCLALAERVHSGYEAPRIPLEKRIFTTTHSPGCVFMEVDDRAVPLLGYLPQDLIGSSVLACLHPEDRPLMLALHHKILKYAGQRPFEDRSFRLRCQNGDYVTLDTSWSSFVNPWSRKVAFVIGRHRVRTGPLNEEVFATRGSVEQPRVSEEIQELQTQIYRLFLQPVYNNGSSGYGSMGSNGSHEPYVSMSSSESNGNLWEDSLREPMKLRRICSDVRRVKAGGQQGLLDSRCKLPPWGGPQPGPQLLPLPPSQWRAESPSAPPTRIPGSRTTFHPTSKSTVWTASSDTWRVTLLKRKLKRKTPPPLPLRKIRVTGQRWQRRPCRRRRGFGVGGDSGAHGGRGGGGPADGRHAPRPQPSPLGLTKEVLSAHTQKEEQEYVGRFRHRILQGPYRSYLQRDSSPGPSQQRGPSGNHGEQEVGGAARRKTRVRELKAKRRREQWSSDSYASPPEGHCVAPSPCQNGPPPSPPRWAWSRPTSRSSGCLAPPSTRAPCPIRALVPPAHPVCCLPRGLRPPRPAHPLPLPGALDPPSQLFSSSRSSSPLQLNLLQEELPKPAQPQGPEGDAESQEEAQRKEEEGLSDSGNHDNRSTSSEVLDLLLQEDAHSRTGSNVSGSNGTSTSNTGSGDSSLYFASSDSSHTSPPASRGQPQGEQAAEDRANFKRCVENSLWSLIQHTPEPVMMTYQISPRDQAQVLKEDRERLLLLAPLQPVFTEAQKEELAEVHPWMKEHGLPEEINTQGCVTCMPDANSPAPPISATPHTQDHPPQDPSPDT
ncbi:hypothetical protein ANANG_G00229110 [Anguilla anguilla]|uniref:PAS domain-containing protein n=1 Tax=Anguilla anguilla TaxID=7936 RepID=A0A9D3M1B2_ANGAN|nr:hypothetical protein ANANG_G00229110 [Anguilla anguilla]